MSQYYFAVSSLPHLTYEMEKIPTIDWFLEICRENCAGKDLDLIKCAGIDECEPRDVANKMLREWYIWERNLRNNLTRMRAKKKGVDPEQYIRESDDPELLIEEKIAREAYEHGSPLAAEDVINWERWLYLEELEFEHYFDIEKLIIYYLKLQLLWRKESFQRDRGSARFNEIIQKISGGKFPQEIEQ